MTFGFEPREHTDPERMREIARECERAAGRLWLAGRKRSAAHMEAVARMWRSAANVTKITPVDPF